MKESGEKDVKEMSFFGYEISVVKWRLVVVVEKCNGDEGEI